MRPLRMVHDAAHAAVEPHFLPSSHTACGDVPAVREGRTEGDACVHVPIPVSRRRRRSHTPHEFVPPGYKVNSAASHIRNESPRSGLVLLLRACKFRYHLGARTVGSFAAFSTRSGGRSPLVRRLLSCIGALRPRQAERGTSGACATKDGPELRGNGRSQVNIGRNTNIRIVVNFI